MKGCLDPIKTGFNNFIGFNILTLFYGNVGSHLFEKNKTG
jgi:hypothetical protein